MIGLACPAGAPLRRLGVSLALLGGIILLAYAPLLTAHAGYLWQRPYYQHLPIVPLAAAYVALRRPPGILHPQCGKRRASWMLLGGAWGLLAVAVLAWSPWLGMVSALGLLLAVIYCVGGTALARQMLPAWSILWLLVPLPLGLDTKLVAALQPLVTRASSRVLDLLEVWHVPTGNVLVVDGRHLLVEESCSGVQSLYSLFACACLFLLWVGRPLVPALLLLVATLAASLLANVCRVVATAYLTVVWHTNVEDGWRHEAVGLVVFVVTLGLLVSWDGFLSFFWHPAHSPRVPKHAPPSGAPNIVPSAGEERRIANVLRWWAVLIDARLSTKLLMIAYGLVAGLQVSAYLVENFSVRAARPTAVGMTFDAELLPAAWGDWRRRDFNEHLEKPEGLMSASWTYKTPAGLGVVSVTMPFFDWHPLEICYQSQGWTLEDYEERLARTPTDVSDAFVAVRFRKPLQSYGYLYYSLRGEHGTCVPPPARSVWSPSGWLSLRTPLGGLRLGSRGEPESDQYMQEQLFVETDLPLSPAGLAGVEAFFLQARACLRKR